MNRLGKHVVLVGIAIAWACAAGAALSDSDPDSTAHDSKPTYVPVPYAPGELLTFSIDYGPVNAGEASLEVRDILVSGGRDCYRVESKARSNRVFSAFYMVRDKVVSHIDRATLFSRYFSKRLREGDYRKNIAIRFDHDAGLARYADGRDLEIEPGVHDILSAFYFVRTLDLEPGHSTFIHTHSSHKNYDLEVKVHGRETISVPAGKFDCYKVEPIILGEGLFQFEGKLTIWLSADQRRLPVLMKTKVKVGAIDASLKSFVLGKHPDREK
jgi:hypothetical protein